MTIEELIAYVEADPMRQANKGAHDAVMAALGLARAAAGLSRRRTISHLDPEVEKMNVALHHAEWA